MCRLKVADQCGRYLFRLDLLYGLHTTNKRKAGRWGRAGQGSSCWKALHSTGIGAGARSVGYACGDGRGRTRPGTTRPKLRYG